MYGFTVYYKFWNLYVTVCRGMYLHMQNMRFKRILLMKLEGEKRIPLWLLYCLLIPLK